MKTTKFEFGDVDFSENGSVIALSSSDNTLVVTIDNRNFIAETTPMEMEILVAVFNRLKEVK